VTEIGLGAFEGCISLENIFIPKTIKGIGGAAFCGCQNLKFTIDPDNPVYAVQDNCLFEKSSNTLICACNTNKIPDFVSEIQSRAFSGNAAIREVVIPDSINKVGEYVFSNCPNLESVTVLTKSAVYPGVFSGCKNLKNVTISNAVEIIADEMFANCVSLESITIPYSVTEIGESAFAGCEGLKHIPIPESVKKIGFAAFQNCKSLKTIELPASISYINKHLFKGCRGLEHIVIPDSVTSIGTNAFEECVSLTDIVIPSSVIEFEEFISGSEIFNRCENLKSATILAPLKKIPENTFDSCHSLEVLTLGIGIKKIDEFAFSGCNSLKTIYVPAKKADYYKKRLPEELHHLIVELPEEKKKK
jgi:hypothetical protein